jgi:hypothetical protein
MLATAEIFSHFTPLGIRFWDPVTDRQIVDGLNVTAYPLENPNKRVNSFRTRSNIYSFSHLPGMRDLELEITPIDAIPSPPQQKPFVIQIKDSLNRYIDVSFKTALPLSYSGVFLTRISGSPAQESPRGFYLYSSVSRNLPNIYAVVRGELVDNVTGASASHALIKVLTEDNETWFGIADEKGRFVVVFPYPNLADGFGGSPSALRGPLHEQSWNINLEICYSPSSQKVIPGSTVPVYPSILKQSVANIFPFDTAVSSPSLAQLPLLLEFNQPTITKTDGQHILFVSSSVP